MAEDNKKSDIGFVDIINSVDKASADELAALARIEKKLAVRPNASTSVNQSAPNGIDNSVPRSVQLAEKRRHQRENERQKAVKENSNSSNSASKNHSNGDNKIQSANSSHLTDKIRSNDSKLVVKVVSEGLPDRKQSRGGKEASNLYSNDNLLEVKEKNRQEALKSFRSAPRITSQPHIDVNGRARDENGKFTSRDKINQDKAAQHDSDSARHSDSEDRKSQALITRIAKALSESGDPLDATSTNAAGMAAGGSFWKAGHEAYTLGKNTVGSGISSVKKMGELLQGDKNGASGEKRPGMFRSLLTRGQGTGRTSSSVIASNAQREQRKLVEDQTETIKEGDKVIVEKLDELIEHQGGNKSSGLAKILGGLAAGGLGRKLLGSLLGALGAKKLAERVRGKGNPGFDGDALSRGRKRRKNHKGRLPELPSEGDCGCDNDLPGQTGAGNEPKRKRTPKERRKAARKRLAERKARQRLGKGLLGRFGKKAAIAGGTAVAGAVAVDAISDAISTTDAGAVKKEASQRAAHANSSVSEPKTPDAAVKTAGKGALKETESAAAKVATKGAEKIGAKVATKAVAATALRAIPVVGQVVGAGIDGVMGWRDREGQQSAFNLKDGQEATKRQKTEYAAANIADFGGLLSGGARLLSAGADKLGFHGVAKKLDFTTDDMARGLDNTVSKAKSSVKSVSDALGITKAQSDQEKGDEKRNQSVVTAIQDGAKSTVDAITSLFTSGKEAVVNGVKGTYESIKDGASILKARITEPLTDNLSPDLNIGGANARNRNFRNNNFGNLEFVGQAGARLENANANGERRFARFDTPEEGIRGLGNQLMSYYNGTSKAAGYQKLQNIDQIISKYAPSNENNTQAYKASLAKQLGVGITDKIDLSNPDVMAKMVRSVSTVEGGNPQVTDKFITTALGQYQQDTNGKGKWVGEFNDSTLAKVNEIRKAQGQDALTKDAQFSGIAAMNGKVAQPQTAAEVTPAAPAQHAQAVKRNGTMLSANGVNFYTAHLPGENSAIGKWAMEHGGGKLSSAEGLRHQAGSGSKPDLIPDKVLNPASNGVSTAEGPRAPSEGLKFNAAKLPGQDSAIGKWAMSHGGSALANAEGLRHQANVSTKASAVSRPNMTLPAKMPAVNDMAASHVQPTVNVANQQSLPKEIREEFAKMNKTLEKIAGHTKETAEKSGDATPKANTPQPAPRGSTPLSINDPLMASVAND